MPEPKTHRSIDAELVGRPLVLETGRAVVELVTHERMAADDRGLVHGGFLFGLADYAAMLAVDEPTVVLAGSNSRFRKPVVVGEVLHAVAEIERRDGPKTVVQVSILRRGEAAEDGSAVVYTGEFRCFSPERHVLDGMKGD